MDDLLPEGRPLTGRERRRTPRVALTAHVRTVGATVRQGTLEDLSVGGACVRSAQPLGVPGESVVLLIDHPQNPVEVLGEIVRSEATRNAIVTGLRFTLTDPLTPHAVFNLVHGTLLQSTGARRRYTRIPLRLSVRLSEPIEREAMLLDLSYGGAALMLETSLSRPTTLLHFLDDEGREALSLPTRVVSQSPLPGRMTRVGLCFDALDAARALSLDLLIRRLARGGDLPLAGWRRRCDYHLMRPARPTRAVPSLIASRGIDR